MMNKTEIKIGQADNYKQAGFSLVELLVVIAILALLIGILMPSLSAIRDQGYRTKSLAAITTLSNGCLQYKTDNKYYPGQKYTTLLAGTTTTAPEDQDNTGSQMLAACLLDNIDANRNLNAPANRLDENDIADFPKDDYIEWNKDLLIWENGSTKFTLSDKWKSGDEMPLLYYPSRIGNDGTIPSAFRIADNAVYDDGNNNANVPLEFAKAIQDKRFDGTTSTKAYNADTYLLFAPGVDRKYFTGDDIKNFDN